jgi:hypothetical protein
MEHRTNVYQLAQPYQPLPRKNGPFRTPLTPIPFAIKEESTSPQRPKVPNIFQSRSDFQGFNKQPEDGYHAVGNK